MLEDWRGEQDKSTCLIVAQDDDQAAYFNRRCSDQQYAIAQSEWEKRLHESATSSAQSTMPFYEQEGKRFAVGSRVRFCQRGRLGDGTIENELGTVKEVNHEVETIDIELDRDKLVTFAMDNVPEIDHGYAVSHEQAQEDSLPNE